MKSITLITYPTAFFIVGGGEHQFINSYEALKQIRQDVRILDTYRPDPERTSCFHLFTVCGGIEHYIAISEQFNIPIVLSPIHWPRDEELGLDEYNRIRRILCAADVICVSSDQEGMILKTYYSLPESTKTRVVFNGVSSERLLGNTRKDVLSDDRRCTIQQQIRVLCMCNIDKRKNLERLAEACKELGYRLEIAGHIRDRVLFEEILTNYKNVTYLGPYSKGSDEYYAMLEDVDIFALASLYETPGLAALEAAVEGLSILITEIGGTKEYFKDYVEYCNPYDVNSIKAGLERASKRQKAPDGLRKLVLMNYNWEYAARQLSEIYDEVLCAYDIQTVEGVI